MGTLLSKKISEIANRAGQDIIDVKKSMNAKDLSRIIERAIYVSIGEMALNQTEEKKPPQSKFIEEWFEYWEHLEIEFPKINNWHIFVKIMMLIDKHKKDKEG